MGASIDTWLQRFAASDAQEEEVIDQSSAYRALLGEKTPDPEVADKAPQPTQRRLRKPAPSP